MTSYLFGENRYRHINGDSTDNRKENLIPINGNYSGKKIYINGYIEYYLPEHHRASKSSGCVYEHILIAEEKLGRKLYDEEVVHHIDKNKSNNSPENLMIFATKSDHTAYHKGAKLIRQNDGTYKCEKTA